MKNLKGFTIVELAVVIMVIAFTITVLLPAFTTAANKETSFRAVCANRLKNYGIANTIYSNEYNGNFCPFYFEEPNATGPIYRNGQRYSAVYWLTNNAFRNILKLDSYPKNKRNAPVPPTSSYNGPYNMPAEFLCPADKVSIDWKNQYSNTLLSYAYNVTDWLRPDDWSGTLQFNPYMGHNAGNMPAPSTKLAFIDGIDWWTAWNSRGADYYNWDRVGQQPICAYRNSCSNTGVYSYGPVLYRHNEGANIAFYDGHVQYMRKQKIFVYADIYYPGTRNLLPLIQRRPGMWVVDMDTYLMNQ